MREPQAQKDWERCVSSSSKGTFQYRTRNAYASSRSRARRIRNCFQAIFLVDVCFIAATLGEACPCFEPVSELHRLTQLRQTYTRRCVSRRRTREFRKNPTDESEKTRRNLSYLVNLLRNPPQRPLAVYVELDCWNERMQWPPPKPKPAVRVQRLARRPAC
eukprot:3391262-Pleurochrysis_carterae.AAC.2